MKIFSSAKVLLFFDLCKKNRVFLHFLHENANKIVENPKKCSNFALAYEEIFY